MSTAEQNLKKTFIVTIEAGTEPIIDLMWEERLQNIIKRGLPSYGMKVNVKEKLE